MHDILVIGAGIAGLTVALKAAEDGKSVLLLTKGAKPDGSTNYAQGGIASVTSPEDSFESHIADTLEAGDGLCKKKQVEILTRSAPEAIEQLLKWGVNFTASKNDGKAFDLHLEGGHSYRRILHTADLTGKEIMRALLAELKQRSREIDFIENSTVFDLLTQKSSGGKMQCVGAIVAEQNSKRAKAIYAKTVVLATGGAGQLWLHSTNPPDACGEGISMVYRAGAALQDLEFMQFHPTSLYAPQLKKTFLISEAVRGFGGILKNHKGEEFMNEVHPLRSLAPRDIVARAILREMQNTGKDYMYLDVTHRKAKDIKTHFPNIYAKCLECKIDITKDWIPVVPAAHYICGGVLVDSFSRTTIDGLYACGEISATGVHGANRLASNSLLESVVFSLRACEDISKKLKNAQKAKLPKSAGSFPEFSREDLNLQKAKREVQTIMWEHCGIVRSMKGLKTGLEKLTKLENSIPKIKKNSPLSAYEFRNFIESAKLVIENALKRKESRGLQCLTDYPEKNPACLVHYTVRK
ncbi:MAG: L-aspartate oxidase [Fibromonadaceae bacterium]|jgi:L-aspartate oxidase|nr:L-aspartate oxidase [Fibromonadaceae bacterium]